MAERELNLVLKTNPEEARQLREELKRIDQQARVLDTQFKKGEKTADQVEKGIADLTKRYKELNLARTDTINTETRLWHIQNRAQVGFKSMATEVKSATTALRSSNVAAINFGRILQDLPFGLTAVANNIDPAAQSFRQLGVEAKEAGVSMRSAIFGAILGPVGIMAAISSLFVALPILMRMLKDTENAFEQAASKGIDKFVEGLGKADPYQLSRRRQVAISARGRIEESLEGRLGPGNRLIYDLSPEERALAEQKLTILNTYIDRLDKELVNQKALLVLKEMNLTTEEKITNEKAKQASIDAGLGIPVSVPDPTIQREVSGGGAIRTSGYGPYNRNAQADRLRREAGFAPRGEYGFPRTGAENIKAITGDARQLQSDLTPIFAGIGGTISTYIGGAFRSVFGEAQGLAADLLSSILGGLVSFGVAAGLTALFPGAAALPGVALRGTVSPGGVVVATNRRRSGGGGGGGGGSTTRLRGQDVLIGSDRAATYRRMVVV